MNFTISQAVFDVFPALHVGVLVARGIDNTGNHVELVQALRQAEQCVASAFEPETFKEHPHLVALQEVHRSFGSNPNKFPPSVQAMIKRIVKGGQLPTISPLVDAYNVVSLRHVLCAGAEDIDTCSGDIVLDYADGSEDFIPLGESENDSPAEGELVYKDDRGVICRKLNWREGDRSKITDSTKNAVLVLEGFTPVDAEMLQVALQDLSSIAQQYCGGEMQLHMLNSRSPSWSI